MVKAIQYIELRGDNPLKAVVTGTNANAHLVATAAIAQGLDLTAEQYHMSKAQVHGALAFYYENKDVIEQKRAENRAEVQKYALTAQEFAEKLKHKKVSNDEKEVLG
jgi:hypothetical protein